ncbi:hypothetical protein PsYK624_077320 [Phanerochaete sordida]|uniref:Protein-S-isoprenylcysteine O-methyltransferase n=1 Tax=Phanerochaete sordida TaxID=48140 RepID=A0A9P3G977_9APHY|nr:hypothetical protein PsYK624_077320 [Phanerochaete sordida]
MTLARALVVVAQGVFYQMASSPPNKTPQKARYDADHPWFIRIAPLVMKVQVPLIWACSAAELLLLATPHLAVPASAGRTLEAVLCAGAHKPALRASPFALAGLALVACGSMLRLACYRALGDLFTFDLTIFPSHALVTGGPYSWVRHPAYTGTLAMCLGIGLIGLTPGSWVAECAVRAGWTSALLRLAGAAVWWCWWLSVGVTRCRAEDAELKKKFGAEWEKYAARVPWWFVPGLM